MRTEINEVQQKYNFTKLSNSQHLHFERGVYTTTAFETIQLEDEKACRRVAFGSSVRPKVLWRWWSDFDYCSLSQEQLLLIVVVRGACSNFHPKPASLLYPVRSSENQNIHRGTQVIYFRSIPARNGLILSSFHTSWIPTLLRCVRLLELLAIA